MKRITLPAAFAAVLIGSLLGTAASGAPPVIGMVSASGAFRLNGDTVMVNGTLTDGAVIESGRSDLSVRLTGGARLLLSPNSRGRLYRDRMLLEKGETRLENGAAFHLEVLELTIRPDRASSAGRIGLLGRDRVRVATREGSFQVRNARGVLVGNVPAGLALAFEPQAPAAAATTHITGTLTLQSGHFLLTDQVTHVTVELTGQGLAAHVGQIVEVTGTLNAAATPVAGASQVIVATQVHTVAAVGAAGAGAAPAAAGGVASGAAIGVTTVAIVGGVAVAAVLGGLAANDLLPGQGDNSPVSR